MSEVSYVQPMDTFLQHWWLPPVQPDVIETFTSQLSISQPVATTLANRRLRSVREALAYLHPTLDHLHDPLTLPDMDTAVHRVLRAVEGREQIVVYGHDDVDGITSTLVLLQAIRSLKGNVHSYIPDRVTEGTGLSWGGLNLLAQGGAKLVVTVDCGLQDQQVIENSHRLSTDVIVVDHHEVGGTIPRGVPFVNPKRSDCSYLFRDLAGVGVSFKLAQALVLSKGKPLHRFFDSVGDLVALGTLADKTPLVNENRVLTKLGLDLMRSRPRPGLAAVLALFNEPQSIHQEFLMSKAIPILSSANSIQGQSVSLDLLQTEDREQAAQLARELLAASHQWQQAFKESYQRISEKVKGEHAGEDGAILVIDDPTPPRVLGTCASKLMREHHRPAVVLSFSDDRYFGEARGPKGCNLVDLLGLCRDLLITFGGHKQAAGFSLFPEHIDRFRERLTELSKTMSVAGHSPHRLDSELDISSLDQTLLRELDMLAPFGRENPNPLFLSRDVTIVPTVAERIEETHTCIGTVNGFPVVASQRLMDDWRKKGDRPSVHCDIIYQISRSNGDAPQIVLRDVRCAEASC